MYTSSKFYPQSQSISLKSPCIHDFSAQFAHMCIFKVQTPKKAQVHKCNLFTFWLSHQQGDTFNKFGSTNKWLPQSVCFPATLTGWQPLAQGPNETIALSLKEYELEAESLSKPHETLVSEFPVSSKLRQQFCFYTVEILSCHLRGTTKIYNPELLPLDDKPQFLPFCIIFSSLLVRKKNPPHWKQTQLRDFLCRQSLEYTHTLSP